MTDNELKENCLQEAGIDLGRYSHTELNEIKDALRRYHQSKLKLLGIADVSDSRQGEICQICCGELDADYGNVCSECDDSHLDD